MGRSIILYQKKIPFSKGIQKYLLSELGLNLEYFLEEEKILKRISYDYFLLLIDIDDFSDDEIENILSRVHNKNVILFCAKLERYKNARIEKDKVSDYLLLNDSLDLKQLSTSIKLLQDNKEKRILLILNNLNNDHGTLAYLKKKNYIVDTLEKREDYTQKIELLDYSLVALECNSEEDIQVIKSIRKKYSKELLPIMTFSSGAAILDSALLFKQGANEYVSGVRDEDFAFRAQTQIELCEHIKKVKSFTNIDPATGLNNLIYFNETAGKFYESAKRAHVFLTFGAIDIDNIEEINKKYGYFLGNSVLKEAANILSARFRESDLLCYAGEGRFYILAQNMNLSSTEIIFESIKNKIENLEIQIKGEQLRTKVSIGVNTYLEGSLDSMIDTAINLLLNAKKDDGNRVIIE